MTTTTTLHTQATLLRKARLLATKKIITEEQLHKMIVNIANNF